MKSALRNPLFLFLCLSLVLIVGCKGKTTPEEVSTPEIGVSASGMTKTQDTTQTNIFTSTVPMPLPTQTTTPTLSVTRYPTQTVTGTPKSTLFPTIAPEDRDQYVQSLASMNKICEPPCWMNIIPGETAFMHVKDYLRSISIEYDDYNYTPNKRYSLLDANSGEEIYITLHGNPNIITRIQIAGTYPLNEFIVQNGIPEEVWIRVEYGPGLDYWPFKLVFFYPSKGMMATYDGKLEGEEFWITLVEVRFCPSKIDQNEHGRSYVRIDLWPPDEFVPFEDAYNTINNYPQDFPINFYRLTKISFLNEEEFYEIYSNPSNIDLCIPLDYKALFPYLVMVTPTATE